MRTKAGLMLAAAGLLGAWQVSGCGGVLPTIPVPIPLGSASDFDVEAGTPRQQAFQTSGFNTGGLQVGRGSVELDPTVITVDETDNDALQLITCGDACALAGVDAATCTAVCEDGQLQVTIWVGLASEADTVCSTGDEYGPYLVTLDGENNPVSVDPSTATLQPKTIQAINNQAASICLEVISPVTGTVTIDSIILNAGL